MGAKDSINTLRKSVRKSKRVEDGTVVRYDKRYHNEGRTYNYVAIYVAALDNWYTTGVRNSVIGYDDMMVELGKAENVMVVSGWDEL